MTGNIFECIAWLTSQTIDTNKLFDLEEHKEKKRKRSLTQNAYYWVMLNKLARKLGMPDSEVHMNMLRDYGVCEVFSVLDYIDVSGYFKYYDVIGHGFANGKYFKHIKVYKGSSKMDSGEFSRLINGMREECESQGIDVMTPSEIALMRFIEPEV